MKDISFKFHLSGVWLGLTLSLLIVSIHPSFRMAKIKIAIVGNSQLNITVRSPNVNTTLTTAMTLYVL